MVNESRISFGQGVNMNVNEFMDFRGDCIENIKNARENALKKYLDKIGFKDIFAYKYVYEENKLIIYTSKPGIWIGKYGVGVELLKDILLNELKENCDVCFEEIHGNFVAHQ